MRQGSEQRLAGALSFSRERGRDIRAQVDGDISLGDAGSPGPLGLALLVCPLTCPSTWHKAWLPAGG